MINISVFFVFILVTQVIGAPFSENSIAVLTFKDGVKEVELREYSLNGSLAQIIALDGYFAEGDHMMSRDQNGKILAVPLIQGDSSQSWIGMPRVVLAINSEGEVEDCVNITSSNPSWNPLIFAAMINGQDVWISLNLELSYATRGATSVLVNKVIGNAGIVATYGQIIDSTMYFLGEDTNPKFHMISPPPTSASLTATMIPRADGNTFSLNSKMFVYDATTVYFVSSLGSISLQKYEISSGKLVLQYAATPAKAPRDVVAQNIGGIVYVYVLGDSTIVRYTDDGTQFKDSLVLVTDMPYGQSTNMALSPQPTCSDSFKNQGESDVDCGGSKCSKCPNDKSCLANSDCQSSYCNPDSKCSVPICSDGWQNQDETDIDCGGLICDTCGESANCKIDSDCFSTYCNPDLVCSLKSCSDGWMNQNETDVDCGGNCQSKCGLGKKCNSGSDCQSGTCSDVCVAPPVAPQSNPSPESSSPSSVNEPQSVSPTTSSPTTLVAPTTLTPTTLAPNQKAPDGKAISSAVKVASGLGGVLVATLFSSIVF